MKIVLIGAYGYTARLICELLNLDQINLVAVGKNLESLTQLKEQFDTILDVQIRDITKKDDCKAIVQEFDLFINCAGPFHEESSLFLEVLSNASNKIYLDISGELGFIRDSRKKYHHLAEKNHHLIIHGCAFESMISDLLLTSISNQYGKIQEASIYYQFGHSKPSPGTRITMKMAKYRSLLAIENGEWKELTGNEKHMKKDSSGNQMVAAPYPLPEVAFLHWNDQVKNCGTYLLIEKEEGFFVGSGKKTNTAEEELAQLKLRKPAGPTPEQRASQSYAILFDLTLKDNYQCSYTVQGTDMYLTTAQTICLAVNQLKEGNNVLAGVQSPAALFNEPLETLRSLGIVIHAEKENEGV